MYNHVDSIRNQRRPVGKVSSYNISHIHLRNPWITALWSAMFPGFGHIMLGCHIRGWLLIGWEYIINDNAYINTAIMYTFLGDFSAAANVLNKRWALLYLGVWAYTIWRGYDLTVSMNKLATLGTREDSNLLPVTMGPYEINFLDKKQPWVALSYSLISPGLGHLYNGNFVSSFFCSVAIIVTVYYSHILEAIHFSFLGAFAQATAVLDPQWLLHIPSLYGFAAYDAYVNAVEENKLFAREQARFLRNHYQKPQFQGRLTEAWELITR